MTRTTRTPLPEAQVDLSVTLGSATFANPITTASGCFASGAEIDRFFDIRDLGAVVVKSVTPEPREGLPTPRMTETPSGMLNAIGLQNPGARHVIDTVLPQLDFSQTRFIANVSGSTLEEYVEVTRLFDDSPIDAIELNISCPNVKAGGVQFGNDPDMSARVVAACRAVTAKPLITKLSPNQTDIQHNARRCIEAGTDAFAVVVRILPNLWRDVQLTKRVCVFGHHHRLLVVRADRWG